MSASMKNGGEPNLTPILDMVFQLITFFMLVINFKGAALDLKLQLPVLGSARPVEEEGDEGLLVLNVNSEGEVTVYNKPVDVAQYIGREAQLEGQRLIAQGKAFQAGDELPTTVVIRADRRTPFNLLNEVITVCQTNGYRKFALKAMNRREGA